MCWAVQRDELCDLREHRDRGHIYGGVREVPGDSYSWLAKSMGSFLFPAQHSIDRDLVKHLVYPLWQAMDKQ